MPPTLCATQTAVQWGTEIKKTPGCVGRDREHYSGNVGGPVELTAPTLYHVKALSLNLRLEFARNAGCLYDVLYCTVLVYSEIHPSRAGVSDTLSR